MIYKNFPTFVRNDEFTGLSEDVHKNSKVGGSREHYFHFLIGYLLPIVGAQKELKFKEFSVLDCGPLMTPMLRETLSRLRFKFRVKRPIHIKQPYYVEAWDHRCESLDRFHSAVRIIRNAWLEYKCTEKNCRFSENILIKRSEPHIHYLKGPAEIKGYGTSRRAVLNWREVCDFLTAQKIEYILYEPGKHSLGCQIATFSYARRIVGIRGAEWANVVWTKPGVKVRVFDPQPPAELLTGLFVRLNIAYEFEYADTSYCTIDPVRVLNTFIDK